MSKQEIIQEINDKFPFLIQQIQSDSIEEMIDMIEAQRYPENSDFQGFFMAFLSDNGYKFMHNSSMITTDNLKQFENIMNTIVDDIDNYNILNDLLNIELNSVYLIFKIYIDPKLKNKIFAVGHILTKNINTRLLILNQKQNKLIKENI